MTGSGGGVIDLPARRLRKVSDLNGRAERICELQAEVNERIEALLVVQRCLDEEMHRVVSDLALLSPPEVV